jgi:virginiamycin B lyase
MHVPYSPRERDHVRAFLAGLAALPMDLPADARVLGPWISAPGSGPGAVLYVHGGGFVMAQPDIERVMAYRLSQTLRRPVRHVDYRLAPAHPFPAAMDDVVAAYRAVLAEGVRPEDVLVFGESAGGAVALSALLELKRLGAPMPRAAALFAPVTDLTLSGASLRADAGLDILRPDLLAVSVAAYLDGAEPDRAPQSPLHGDLAGLPPLLVAVGGDEVLLDDSLRLARAAREAGVDVRLEVHEGLPHAFHALALTEPDQPVMRGLGEWAASLRM